LPVALFAPQFHYDCGGGKLIVEIMKIDVVLVSGCRPELLSRTLNSFNDKVFCNFTVNTCYANIDPFGGAQADGAECARIIYRYFPNAVISMPDTPGFGAAVKTVWGQSTAPVVLHLEDDWLVSDIITPSHIEPLLVGDTRAVRLLSKHMSWNRRSEFHERTGRYRWMGITYRRVRTAAFGTSPGFLTGAFARTCAELMRPDLDPEKQMRPGLNPLLFAYMSQFKCRVLHGEKQADIIHDIGREWREEKGIVKVVSNGRSLWQQAALPVRAA
jgi:hypothetical protein